ncbi:MAG TPA: glycosyltransferase [Candidatus Limnocylindrales bacterium]
MGERPALSVVVPTRDRRELVLDELRALGRQTLSPDSFEVVVVVDGATDGTAEALRALVPPFALTVLEQPGRGRAAACNAAIAASRGSVVVVLDDDMLPEPAMLEAHRAAHSGEGRLAVLGPVPIDIEPGVPAVTRYIGEKFNRHLEKLAAGSPIGIRDVYTGNFSIRRALLDEVGPFDEDFVVYGNEDGELAARLLEAGVHFIYAREAVARQRYTKSFRALSRDNEAKGRTAVILARKHPHALSSLKLAARSSVKLRLVRGVLLASGRRWPATSRLLIGGFDLLSRALPGVAVRAAPAALDYFYWLGASAELRRGGPIPAAAPTGAALPSGDLPA